MELKFLLFILLLFHGPGFANECIRESLNEFVNDIAPTNSSAIVRPIISAPDIIATFPELSRTLRKIELNIPTALPIKHPREIPFHLSNGGRPLNAEEMIKRADELEPKLSNTIKAVYNTLNDVEVLKKYFQNLFIETAQWMHKQGRPESIELLKQGLISQKAMQVVLIRRFKAQNDKNFTILTSLKNGKYLTYGKKNKDIKPHHVQNTNDAFRAAVRTGPFIDRGFKDTNRIGHGVFNHMIQRDIVRDIINKEMNGSSQDFWNFLGSRKGINWWADLFDSGAINSFVRPERINRYIFHNMFEK